MRILRTIFKYIMLIIHMLTIGLFSMIFTLIYRNNEYMLKAVESIDIMRKYYDNQTQKP